MTDDLTTAPRLIDATLVDLDLDASATDKDGAILRLVTLAHDAGRVTDVEQMLADVRAREAQMATGLEGGIGIPHARSGAVRVPTLVFGRSSTGIDFGAEDGPARIVFLIAAPDDGNGEHLTVLAALARRLVHESFREALINAGDPKDVVELIKNEVENR
ncbi:fructose PTS system EIIA component [Marmoricola sp. URHA0025 HA25]